MKDLILWYGHFQVSLSSIKGTGPEGSVVKADVEEYLGNHSYNYLPSVLCVCISDLNGV